MLTPVCLCDLVCSIHIGDSKFFEVGRDSINHKECVKSVLSGVGFGGHQDLWRKRQSKEGGAEIFFFFCILVSTQIRWAKNSLGI